MMMLYTTQHATSPWASLLSCAGRGVALRNSATRALRPRRACVSADIHCADTVASCAFHSSRAGRGVRYMRRRENAAEISMNHWSSKKPTMRTSASTVAFAFCATIALMLASTSMAQLTYFYNDASCSIVCDGTNCGGAKFVSNPISVSNSKLGECFRVRLDSSLSSKSVIFQQLFFVLRAFEFIINECSTL